MSSNRRAQERDEKAHIELFISLAGLTGAKPAYDDKPDCVLHLPDGRKGLLHRRLGPHIERRAPIGRCVPGRPRDEMFCAGCGPRWHELHLLQKCEVGLKLVAQVAPSLAVGPPIGLGWRAAHVPSDQLHPAPRGGSVTNSRSVCVLFPAARKIVGAGAAIHPENPVFVPRELSASRARSDPGAARARTIGRLQRKTRRASSLRTIGLLSTAKAWRPQGGRSR